MQRYRIVTNYIQGLGYSASQLEPYPEGCAVLYPEAHAIEEERDRLTSENACLLKRIDRYREDAEDRSKTIERLRAEIESHKAIEKSLAEVAESRRQEILKQDDLIATLRAELAAMKSLERDGDWPSYPELALMFTEQGAELAAAREALEKIKSKFVDGNYYEQICVEIDQIAQDALKALKEGSHEDQHRGSPGAKITDALEILKHRYGITDGELQIARLEDVLEQCHEHICSYLCPSTWKTGEEQPHSDLCKRIKEILMEDRP